MSDTRRGSDHVISLDALIALNDEMAALVRSGIPLEDGLTEFGGEMPGRAGAIATRLGQRLSSGESLADVLQHDDKTFPPIWRAVVLAGIRSGNLAAALEGLSETGRQAADLRRSIGVALVYPAILVVIAYGMFLVSVLYFAPLLESASQTLTDASNWPAAGLVWLGQRAIWWAPWLPFVVTIVLGAWWFRSGRAIRVLGTSRGARLFWARPGFWPSIGQSVWDGHMATFVELLALMIKHQVPMSEAIVLAGDASGEVVLGRGAKELADRLSRGEVIQDRDQLPDGIPPLLAWSLASGGNRSTLSRLLLTSADVYRQRVERTARWAAIYFPVVLTVVIGGAVVLVQGLVLFLPLSRLLYQLGLPIATP